MAADCGITTDSASEISGVSVSPISNEEATTLGIPESMLSGTVGRHFRVPDSDLHFLIHVPITSSIVMTYGAYDAGVRFLRFGKINQPVAVGAL